MIARVGGYLNITSERRRVDRDGGVSKCNLRAVVMFGRGAVRAGGAFYRFSLYEHYLVICFFSTTSYKYRDIELVDGP